MELLFLTAFGIVVIGLSAYFVFVREKPRVINDFVTGWRHYEGEKVLHTVKPGDILQMKRQPTNPYDKHAVEIYSSNGVKLGYVSRVYSSAVSTAIANKRVTICSVTGVNPPPAESFRRVQVQINIYK